MGLFQRVYNEHFSDEKEFVRRLKNVLGYTPSNLSIYMLAFSNKASSNSDDRFLALQTNERLEFLGDSILGSIVAEYLFNKYPNRDEGFLTKMRSKVVKRKTLNRIGEDMGLEGFLEYADANTSGKSTLGNTLEAFIGAIYLDIGYYGTRDFVVNRIVRSMVNIQRLETYDDNYKSQLLEWCQKNRRKIIYEIVSKNKKDNRDYFKIAVKIDNQLASTAEDFSKKSAEQKASKQALIRLNIPIVEE